MESFVKIKLGQNLVLADKEFGKIGVKYIDLEYGSFFDDYINNLQKKDIIRIGLVSKTQDEYFTNQIEINNKIYYIYNKDFINVPLNSNPQTLGLVVGLPNKKWFIDPEQKINFVGYTMTKINDSTIIYNFVQNTLSSQTFCGTEFNINKYLNFI